MVKQKKYETTPVQEDYIETIYVLIEVENMPVARVTDIAKKINVSKSNVTAIIKKLNNEGYVNYDTYKWITLTEKGLKEAKKIYKRHKDLIVFFNEILGLNIKTSVQNACRIEHSIDCAAMKRMRELIKFIKDNNVLSYDNKTKKFRRIK